MGGGVAVKHIKVVEIAMEISVHPDILKEVESNSSLYAAIPVAMSTSVGGIGPLLRERIISQAEMNCDVVGISLLYNQVWMQKWHSWGQFYLEKVDSAAYLRFVLKKLDDKIKITMPDGTEEEITVWEAKYGKGKVYFLDCPRITNIVYPGPEDAPVDVEDPKIWARDARMLQSWLLGRGSLALLKHLDFKPDITILSETPTIFAYYDLVSDGLDKEKLFKETKYIFNDHTPLEYAHPVWEEKLVEDFKIKPKYYKNLESYKTDCNKIDITQLLIDAVDSVFGVSLKHGEVMRNMQTLKNYADKIETITNGVSRDIWQSDCFQENSKLTDKEILTLKQKEKDKLVDWMWQRYKFSSDWIKDMKKRPVVMWMRRVTGYKRLDLLNHIANNAEMRARFVNLGITILLGGRIHQNDAHSDWVVFELLDIIQKYPELEKLLILLDNFNVFEAPNLYKGVDASIMISDYGREASATGFMKAQLNGAMIIATEDGAIPESVFYYKRCAENVKPNGFFVEYVNGSPTPQGLLRALEEFKSVYDDQKQRIEMIRSALKQSNKVDIIKPVKEMVAMYKRLLNVSNHTTSAVCK